jgi:hypothetical protein
MYCAFAATPFPGDDWFILRLVKEDKSFAVGFCPDYGDQGPNGKKTHPATARRSEIRKELLKIEDFPLEVSKPEIPKRKIHAFKGFERKLPPMRSPEELAELFIRTVLEWEKLFKPLV